MSTPQLKITYIGGPTALLDLRGLRLLLDPTFDPPGIEYKPGARLVKTVGPAIGPEMLGRVDVVLLSHDHHVDNFDHAGRAVSNSAGKIITTVAGAERLGKNAMGLVP